MTIQETMRDSIIPRVETLVKRNVVIGTSMGVTITNENGAAMRVDSSQVVFSLKFKCSYAEEWTSEMSRLQDADKFPFLFINTKDINQKGDIVTISEMALATWTDDTWTAEQKELNSINPILNNLADKLEEAISDLCGVDSGFKLDRLIVLNGMNPKLNTSDKVDAILFKNTKLRILKHC